MEKGRGIHHSARVSTRREALMNLRAQLHDQRGQALQRSESRSRASSRGPSYCIHITHPILSWLLVPKKLRMSTSPPDPSHQHAQSLCRGHITLLLWHEVTQSQLPYPSSKLGDRDVPTMLVLRCIEGCIGVVAGANGRYTCYRNVSFVSAMSVVCVCPGSCLSCVAWL